MVNQSFITFNFIINSDLINFNYITLMISLLICPPQISSFNKIHFNYFDTTNFEQNSNLVYNTKHQSKTGKIFIYFFMFA